MVDDVEKAQKKCDKGKEEFYETAGDVIVMLSLTGLRKSELRGVRWTDWDEQNQTLSIERAVWRTKVGPTKTASSENTIPVLPLLRDLLIKRRERIKPNPSAYIFAGKRKGAPLNLHNLESRIIRVALKESTVKWSGFHGFRRGLASNLFGLGINPKVIAAILRHSDVSMTLQFYIKEAEGESRMALEKLEAKVKSMNENTGIVFGAQSNQ
jgi:integrase